MVGHEAIGDDHDFFRRKVFAQSLDEEAPVVPGKEDWLAIDAAIVNVISVAGCVN